MRKKKVYEFDAGDFNSLITQLETVNNLDDKMFDMCHVTIEVGFD